MADYAERVLTVLEANTSGHDTKIRTSAKVVDESMTKIERSANRAEGAIRSSSTAIVRSFDHAGQRSRLLGYQIADIGSQLAAGSSPFLILAQQAPQVANALDGATGVAGRMATFFSGPWGAALLAAGSVLGTLLLRSRESTEGLEELTKKLEDNARKAELTRQAQEAFARTLPGVANAIREETEALEQQNHALRNNAEAMLDRAQQRRGDLQAERNLHMLAIRQTEESLASARRRAEDPRYANTPTGEAAAAQVSQLESRLARLRATLGEIDRTISDAERNLAEAEIGVARRQAEALADPIAAINQRYDEMAAAAERAAEGNRTLRDSLAQTLGAIERQRRAALQAEQDRRRQSRSGTDGDLTQFQLPVRGQITSGVGPRGGRHHAGIDIAVPVGTPVGAAAGGVIIEAGNLPGYGNTVIIDHGRGTISRYAHLSRISAQRGATVGQGDVIGLSGGERGAPGSGNSRGPHVHYEVRRGGRAVNPLRGPFPTDPLGADSRAQQIAEREAREAEQRARNEAAFQDELAQLDGELLEARRRNVRSATEIAAFAEQEIEAARVRQNAAYEEAERQGRYTAAQRAELVAANDAVAAEHRRSVQVRLQEQLDQQRVQIASAAIGNEIDLAQATAGLAETNAERRESALRLLDLSYERQRLELEAVIASKSATDAEKQIAQARLDILAQLKSADTEGVRRQTEGARARFLRELNRPISEQLEEMEVDAIRGLADEFANATKEALGLHGVLGDIAADLIRLAAQQAILMAFNAVSGQPVNVPGFASGGSFVIGGRGGSDRNVLSVNGHPVARVSRGETAAIIPQGRQMNGAAGSARSSRPPVTVISAPQFDLRGVITTPALMREMQRVSEDSAARAAAVMGKEVLRAAPGRMAQYQSDGL